MQLKAMIIDDHLLFAEGLASLVQASKRLRIKVTDISQDGDDLYRILTRRKIHIVFLDLNLGVKNGLDLIAPIKDISPKTKILVVSGYENEKFVRRAFMNGADGYLLKGSPLQELEEAIETIIGDNTFMGKGVQVTTKRKDLRELRRIGAHSKGYMDRFSVKHHLTKREHEILQLITQAFSNKEIAQKLFISDQTVSVHRKNIMRKLGVSNTVSLVKAAQNLSIN